ncbi:TldD/PmbA family protein [Veronia nyctiphanis]|uniref:TldD/PmbA family protein n=1 Tax=Veronia nyctiphanis TaxID=1278244 RepID=UPI00191C5F41|nr:TldD/PmbA family protein [Veronia nyctiphanis]
MTNHGGEVSQQFHFVHAGLSATAFADGEAQTRDTDLGRVVMQGGWERLQDIWFGKAQQLGEQAKELVFADNCPEQTMDLLLTSDQMMLQIHESIGHPIELDRILGDERNFAGTSFVTPDMFGNYQYGSELLNVSFDPTIPNESASYGFDDDGSVAEKAMLIEGGVLKRGLGGTISQQRLGVDGVACSRSDTWRRPPLDRMANLNVEAGDKSIEDLIGGIEHGIMMNTNRSWSIDDSRNKFQFGCQYGQLIENGALTKVVKNPNYRGISSAFWRNLSAVGDLSTFGVHGTPYCGKAELCRLLPLGTRHLPVCLKTLKFSGGKR